MECFLGKSGFDLKMNALPEHVAARRKKGEAGGRGTDMEPVKEKSISSCHAPLLFYMCPYHKLNWVDGGRNPE